MTLNRNPDNFFAETEQVAFHPGHVVPGIDFTNDPLLQGRLFSYLDTQLIRLGGPNFHEIPINRPLAPNHNNQRDGFMRQQINKGRVNYEPNSIDDNYPAQAKEKEGGFVSHTEKIDATKIRARSKSFNDYFSQATLFYNSQTEPEKKQIISAFQFELGKVEREEIRKRMVGLLTQVDMDLARQVSDGLGFEVPDGPIRPVQHGVPADDDAQDYEPPNVKQAVQVDRALSMAYTVKGNISSRVVGILCADGVDEESVESVRKQLQEKGAMVKIIAPHLGRVKTSSGLEMVVDKSFSTTTSVVFDAVFVPSGEKSIEMLKENAKAVNFVHEAYKHCKPIAMDGNAQDLLKATYIDRMALGSNSEEQGVILKKKGEGLADSFIHAIGQHRFWEREKTDMIPT